MEEDKGEEGIRLRLSALLGYPPQSASRRPKPRPLQQEVTMLAKEDRDTGSQCVQWLRSLSPGDRWRALTIRDPWFASILREMFACKVEQGEFVFMFVEEDKHETRMQGLTKHFYKRQATTATCGQSSQLKQEYEREMEQRVRFVDWNSYIDTIAIDYKLAEDLPHLLDLFSHITSGQAFTSPCRAHFESGQWFFESPRYLCPSFNSLALWTVAWLERGVWMQYWKAAGLDPRSSGEKTPFAVESFGWLLKDLEPVSRMWVEMSPSERVAALQETEASAQRFLDPSARMDAFLGIQQSALVDTVSVKLASLNKTKGNYYQKNFSLIEHNNEVGAVRDLRVRAEKDPHGFVKFLMLSSLDRAMTILDMCCRELGLKLFSQWDKHVAAKHYDEFINSLSSDSQKGSKKKKKRKQKPKPSSTATDSPEEVDNAAWCKELVWKVAETALDSAQVDSSSWCKEVVWKAVETALSPAAAEQKTPSWPFVAPASASNIPLKIKELNPLQSPTKAKKAKKKKTKRNKKVVQSDVVGAPQVPTPKRSPTARLHSEVQAFCAQLSSRLSAVQEERTALVASLQEVCLSLFPECVAQVYGSYPLGLALETSDIDIVVCNAGEKGLIRESLQRLGSALRCCKWAESVTVIDTASVPIIKLEARLIPTQLTKVDITFDDRMKGDTGTHLGLERFEYTKRLLLDLPPLREITLVVKELVARHGLNSAYKGHLNSYSLMLWVAARLLSSPFQGKDLGQLLMDFIHFYSREFDPLTMGINITLPQ